ncbi:MAG: hypothetical protein J2P17_36430 [Mycobacterium sp.]|nr:hypothetical protein [Mycobacterium sp.]
MRVWMLRIGISLALATTFAAAALPVAAHPTLDVGNPRPNDRLTPGVLTMRGVAFDRDATQGTGVDHVLVFLGSRDHGGQLLGEARLGMPSTMAMPVPQFGVAGWILRTLAIKGAGEQRTIFAYAHSSVTDTETVVKIPVIVGHQPPPPGPSVAQDSSAGGPGLPSEEGGPEE